MPRLRLPKEEDFSSRLRGPAVASRVGLWLGICFVVAFVTGLYSHVSQEAVPWFTLPTRPSWAYQVSQGLHVISGTAAVPLLLVKLWSVFPKLFAPPPWTKPRTELVLNALERASIGVLVAAAIFQLVTGLANSAQWYPWSFGFRSTHYAVGWIAIGAILVHVAVKLPVIRRALGSDVDDDSDDGPDDAPAESPHDTPVEAADDTLAEATAGRAAAPEEVDETTGGLSRRGLLRTTWVAAALVVLGTAGSTVPFLRQVSVFGVRSGDGPGGIPINRTAAAAQVTETAVADDYRLTVVHGDREVQLTREDLAGMVQHSAVLPIACVEGWSATGEWTGVRVRDIVARVDAPDGAAVIVSSLQERGAFRETRLPANFVAADDTLLALQLGGEPLSLDHGYPCRIIAPNRPGVLQTKWVSRLEVEV